MKMEVSELVTAVNLLLAGADVVLDEDLYRKWERRGWRPRDPRMSAAVAAVLGSPETDLFPPARARGAAVRTADAAALEPTVRWESPRTVAARLNQMTADTATTALAALDREIDRVVDHYEAQGPFRLVSAARAIHKSVLAMMGGGHPPRVQGQFYARAARVSGVLAYMAINARRPTLATRYCEEAWFYASEAGDRDLQAWIRATQAQNAYCADNAELALELSLDGQHYARPDGQLVRLIANGQARAHAKLRDTVNTYRAVERALAVLDAYPAAPTVLTSCISFGPYGLPRTAANAATAMLGIGDTAQVRAYSAQVDTSTSIWSQSLVGLDNASALLLDGEVEQAMKVGSAALAASAQHPIRSVYDRAAALRADAARFAGLHAVDAFGTTLTTWASRRDNRITAGLAA
ncbi:hypothetical protein [Kutzneria sp. 744]|uniref:hypothetical protein n=1 Tax=Kutzneria sp. (strain 744) TaxID=345341 RepID=UPI000694300D|nr:hypothetical protein [Kutzneria sp. 744]